jgi:nucleotide-binding universal stress UspA family protein
MWDMEPRKILVAVDSGDCEAALVYAVAEARRRGCGLHLVHVARPAMDLSCAMDDVCLLEGELRLAGRSDLDSAAARAQALIDEHDADDLRLSVSTELTHGSVVAALQSLSRHAALLVMEHHGMGESGESATLSVTAGAAAVAHCPVVAVPDGWRPDASTEGSVVVGIEDPARDAVLLRTAVNEALRRGGRLCVVRAPAPGADLPEDITRDVAEDVVTVDADLPVDVVVETGAAAEVLLRHTDRTGLLVVGRHHRRHVIGASLGRTARALLRSAPVPVLVVDPVTGDRLTTPEPAGLAGRG